MCKVFFKSVLGFSIALQNHVNTKLDKMKILMTTNEFKTECYQ